MLPAAEVQRGLKGAWRMMTGRADGLRMLDLSADGFWNSFYAMLLALPPLFISWTGSASLVAASPGVSQTRLSVVPKLALVEFVVWVVPLVLIGMLARRIGIADRFVAYVVASNWGSVLLAWIILPPLLLQMVIPVSEDFAALLSLVFLVIQLALSWRLTNIAIGQGAAMGTAVFSGMFVVSIALTFATQALLGISGA